MPPVSRRSVRLSLGWLWVGATVGMLRQLELHGVMVPGAALPAGWLARFPHAEVMTRGWILPFVAGVAWWILPKRMGGQRSEAGGHALGAGVVLTQLGLAAEVADRLAGPTGWQPVVAWMGWIGIALILAALLPRVRAVGGAPGKGVEAG